MKRLLLAAGVLALLGAGLAWGLRRQPSAVPLEAAGQGFSLESVGAGRWFRCQDAQSPLRALHWLPPLPGGFMVAQALGQNDRQRLALARPGQSPETLLILKPLGVGEGFWRFAALVDAVMVTDGELVLLYQPGDPGSAELPMVLGLDVASQQVRWSFRAAGTRLAVTPGGEAVYLYGGKAPLQRMALAAAGQQAQGGPQPLPRTVELPPEVPEVEDFLPTGGSSFLVSHRDGLSAYQVNKGWSHFPAPVDPGVPCQDSRSALARAGKGFWWQARPGLLQRIGPDGRPLAPPQTVPAQAWPAEDPLARDGQLLRLLGADPDGALWFALATPAPAAPAPAPPAPAAAEAAAAPPVAAPEATPAGEPGGSPGSISSAPSPPPEQPGAGDWAAYAAAQGLDRLYRWNPSGRTLERVSLAKAWAGLNPPSAVLPPVPVQGRVLVPAAGALLRDAGQGAWWLPLSALPMAPVTR
jgi:hypothetical protein